MLKMFHLRPPPPPPTSKSFPGLCHHCYESPPNPFIAGRVPPSPASDVRILNHSGAASAFVRLLLRRWKRIMSALVPPSTHCFIAAKFTCNLHAAQCAVCMYIRWRLVTALAVVTPTAQTPAVMSDWPGNSSRLQRHGNKYQPRHNKLG